MSATDTGHNLKELPLRALLAYTVRCVRRVQSLYTVPAQLPAATACVTAIGKALELIEQFAAGEEVDAKTVARIEEATVCALMAAGQAKSANPAPAFVANAAYAATCALKAAIESGNGTNSLASAESAAESAQIAVDAAVSADPEIASSAKLDWEMIHRMRLGAYPELGKGIDPTEDGILGPLKKATKSGSAANTPNLAAQSFVDDSTDERDDEVVESPKPAAGKSLDLEQARKLEMLASMIRSRQKELLAERTAFENEKQAFEKQRDEWKSQNPESRAAAGQSSSSTNTSAEQARLKQEREKFEAERKALEMERAELLREQAELVQKEADLHKELRKLQEEKKRREPKEDALRSLSRQQAAQNSPAQVQELLSQLQEERQRLKAEKEQLAEVLALVTSGRFQMPKSGKKRKAARGSKENGPRLRMILEPGAATQAQMVELFRELSALNTDLGGPGIRFSIEDARVWNVARMANRQQTSSDVERLFLEVHMVSESDPTDDFNLAVWGRFASSLFMALRLDAGLASYFDLSEEAAKEHKSWKLAGDAAKRVTEQGSRKQSSDSEGGLFIDALNARMQKIQDLRRHLEHTAGLVLELLPEQEAEEEEEQQAPAATRPPVSPATREVPQPIPTEHARSGRRGSKRQAPNRSKLVAISLAAVGAAILVAVLCLK